MSQHPHGPGGPHRPGGGPGPGTVPPGPPMTARLRLLLRLTLLSLAVNVADTFVQAVAGPGAQLPGMEDLVRVPGLPGTRPGARYQIVTALRAACSRAPAPPQDRRQTASHQGRHLATDLAIRACQAGHRVLFATATD